MTRVVRHRGNRGLARTFLTGLEAALEMGADIIVNTDGDHQYPGNSIAELVAPIVAGEADLVIGDRQTQPTRRSTPARSCSTASATSSCARRPASACTTRRAAFARCRASSRCSVYLTNPFSYTLETIFAAAENRNPIREVADPHQPATRPSRLFKGIVQYMTRSASIIVQGYSMHNPLRAFGWLSAPFLLLGIGLGLRFLYYFVKDPDYSGHIQSLILAAIASWSARRS